MAQPAPDARTFVAAADAERFVREVLIGNGVPESNAEIVARCLIAADLRGVDTHGMNRIPSYLERVRQGVLDGTATPQIKQVTPVVTQVDGKNGWGFVAADMGMAAAIESARVSRPCLIRTHGLDENRPRSALKRMPRSTALVWRVSSILITLG
jgi:hypothetical protein